MESTKSPKGATPTGAQLEDSSALDNDRVFLGYENKSAVENRGGVSEVSESESITYAIKRKKLLEDIELDTLRQKHRDIAVRGRVAFVMKIFVGTVLAITGLIEYVFPSLIQTGVESPMVMLGLGLGLLSADQLSRRFLEAALKKSSVE